MQDESDTDSNSGGDFAVVDPLEEAKAQQEVAAMFARRCGEWVNILGAILPFRGELNAIIASYVVRYDVTFDFNSIPTVQRQCVVLTNANRTVWSTGQFNREYGGNWVAVLGLYPLSVSALSWTVRIDERWDETFDVGVARRSIDLITGRSSTDNNSWAVSSREDGVKWHNGKPTVYNEALTKRTARNTAIGISVDLQRGSISVTTDGQSHGELWTVIPDLSECYPYITFASHDKFAITVESFH